MSQHVFLLLGMLLILGTGCSSSPVVTPESPATSSVLEPADSVPPAIETPRSPLYEQLMGMLLDLGYEGIGLEHEDETTFNFMIAVFSSPKAKNKKIKYVYSGLQISYDPEQESLTFGEDNDLIKALRFIDKKIPKR